MLLIPLSFAGYLVDDASCWRKELFADLNTAMIAPVSFRNKFHTGSHIFEFSRFTRLQCATYFNHASSPKDKRTK